MNSRERLLSIAAAIVEQNTGMRLVYNEEDDSTDVNKEAAHFLKCNGKRVGRDIELYALVGEIEGDIAMLCDFIIEVLFPLNLQGSAVAKTIQDWGCELLDKEDWDDWQNFFVKEEE